MTYSCRVKISCPMIRDSVKCGVTASRQTEVPFAARTGSRNGQYLFRKHRKLWIFKLLVLLKFSTSDADPPPPKKLSGYAPATNAKTFVDVLSCYKPANLSLRSTYVTGDAYDSNKCWYSDILCRRAEPVSGEKIRRQ